MILAVLALVASQTVDAPVVTRVELQRGSPSCTGSVSYDLPLTNNTLRTRLGNAGRALPLITVCARIDAVDALLPLPDNAAGTLTVQTQQVIIYRRADGTCWADLQRLLTPVNANVLAVRGSVLVAQQLPSVTCARIDQALVGAQIVRGAETSWPSGVVALPLPVQP
jgi:hypothetical protein